MISSFFSALVADDAKMRRLKSTKFSDGFALLWWSAKRGYDGGGMEGAARNETTAGCFVLLVGLWLWAIWACAEHWRGNPNYAYGWAVPLLAFGFAGRRYFIRTDSNRPRASGYSEEKAPVAVSSSPRFGVATLAAVLIFALEFAREQIWHPGIVLWSICLVAVVATLAILRFQGGDGLMRAELFPILFFLTAVPWPPRFEQPIVSGLMRGVAQATTELLHWFGIEAQTSGAAIALRSGLVGISEACSGVRSLQAGLMFGLAMGEWFLLRPSRRVILLVIAVGLALLTNLTRTVALALQAEWHGINSLDRVHDLIGNVMITTLIVLIWIGGRVLATRDSSRPQIALERLRRSLDNRVRNIAVPTLPIFRPLIVAFAVAILSARLLSTWIEQRDHSQTVPAFSVVKDASNELLRIPPEIWNELRPSSGQAIRCRRAELPGGSAECFHFFWKPSPWNRFVLVHRPDICMPGIGWQPIGKPEAVDVSLGSRPVRFYFFHFQRGDVYALQLWGVWRNGEPVSFNYQPAQVLEATVAPASLHLEGKRRSATEIVACNVIAIGNPPPDATALALLRSVFEYKPRE
jgi:exosortase